MKCDKPVCMFWNSIRILLAVLILSTVAGCDQGNEIASDGKLKVLATTTIVADVVHQVGGESINLEILLPVGVDPHTFSPTPQDLARISQAQIVFLNGAGLEESIQKYIDNIEGNVHVVEVSEGVTLIESPGSSEHDAGDPHTWTDPENVKVWVENISTALSELDPAHTTFYRENADTYLGKLDELDTWIASQVEQIPADKRKIVSDHETLAYFARRYGFNQVGTVIPGTSTLAEPSAQEMAQLEDLIRKENISTIFVDSTANPKLTERISQDLGIDIVPIYSGSLTDLEGEAGTYLNYMRYNVTAIVEALK